MTIANIKEIIEKRFQIKMTRNQSYQLLWHSGNEKILVSNIRSDYMVITIIKASTTLSTVFADERELNQILNAFVNIAGELNKNNKGEREMREILFRGKRLDNGEWIYGYYAKLPHPITAFLKDYIVEVKFDETDVVGETDYVLVNPKTVGQFTGLKDKNGVEIYEGDIVKNYFYDGGKENKLGREKSIEIVIYENGMFKFKDCEDIPIGYDNLRGCSFIEIIGNIHENGELYREIKGE